MRRVDIWRVYRRRVDLGRRADMRCVYMQRVYMRRVGVRRVYVRHIKVFTEVSTHIKAYFSLAKLQFLPDARLSWGTTMSENVRISSRVHSINSTQTGLTFPNRVVLRKLPYLAGKISPIRALM